MLTRTGVSPRDTFAAALLAPARPVVELNLPWAEVADRVAEQTGLTVVHGFRNRDDPSCQLCFGAFDGAPVPDRYIEVTPIDAGVEIVLATDGYPELLPTLAATEAALAEDIASDPLRIGAHKSTKAVAPGQVSSRLAIRRRRAPACARPVRSRAG